MDTETLGEQVDASRARLPEIIRFLASMFGPYPFATTGGVVDDLDAGFALENQTRPLYSPEFWEFGAGDAVVVHEIAHQWYGDHVAVEQWDDIWLNEGFATYAEWLWGEHEGLGTADEIFTELYEEFSDDEFWHLTIGDPDPEHLFDFEVYLRGAMTLHALRRAVGDDAFFSILRQGAAPDGNGSTAEFTALAERVSGQQLDELLEAWLYSGSRPEIAAAARRSQRAAAVTAMSAGAKASLKRVLVESR